MYDLVRRSNSEIEILNNEQEENLRELKLRLNEIEKVAYVDYLTKLATRRFLMEKCELLFES
ncbi:hypothetical protein, partial [Ilyobacter sp.]|uniref:hypothetical protein n=1 Tax=Ilyobacter sp. TaxID=3100343 RepID=UPI0035627BF3